MPGIRLSVIAKGTMRDLLFAAPARIAFQFVVKRFCLFVLAAGCAGAAVADSDAVDLVIRPPLNHQYDPFESDPVDADSPAGPSARGAQPAAAEQQASSETSGNQTDVRQLQLRPPSEAPPSRATPSDLAKNPCAGMDEKPLGQLGIGIALTEGKLPDDFASACWNQLNTAAGPAAAWRLWPSFVYNWNATCLCHRPLYFEQINLERHGYGCCEPLQPLASAAHFFATIPALPYCMAVECPCECVYTLGHYRPGSCPPWRHHWPPCSPLAAAAEGGVWTGMVFLIP
jgi:hypothetical protein